MNSFYHLREYDHNDNATFNHRGRRGSSRLARRSYFGHSPGGEGGTNGTSGTNGSNESYNHDGAYEQHTEHSGHAEHGDQEPAQEDSQGADPPVSSELDHTFTVKDIEVYQVLAAVQRGELSAQEAARKLEELDRSSHQHSPGLN